MEHDKYTNLAERLDDVYPDIDNDICEYLRKNDGEYKELWREHVKLQEDFPIIAKITESVITEPVTLSPEEQRALAQYLSLKNDMENIERKQIYFRGHTDNYAFLKKIGAV